MTASRPLSPFEEATLQALARYRHELDTALGFEMEAAREKAHRRMSEAQRGMDDAVAALLLSGVPKGLIRKAGRFSDSRKWFEVMDAAAARDEGKSVHWHLAVRMRRSPGKWVEVMRSDIGHIYLLRRGTPDFEQGAFDFKEVPDGDSPTMKIIYGRFKKEQ